MEGLMIRGHGVGDNTKQNFQFSFIGDFTVEINAGPSSNVT